MFTVYMTVTKLYGFNTCLNRVANIGTNVDGNGYVYGNEWGQACIVPKSGDKLEYAGWIPRPPLPQEQEDLAMSVRGMGGKVMRTYTIGLGQGLHVSAPNTFTEEVNNNLTVSIGLALITRLQSLESTVFD
jgi:hypothetical protein